MTESEPLFDSPDDEDESWHDQWVQDDQANDDDWMFDPNWKSSNGT
jgi:hypothetical protein